MHEVGLMQEVLEIAQEQAARHEAKHISRITLRVGALSGAVPEALEFAFAVVKLGTVAAEAKLEVELAPVACYCPACERDFEPIGLAYECPVCRRLSIHVRGGRELELVSLEVL